MTRFRLPVWIPSRGRAMTVMQDTLEMFPHAVVIVHPRDAQKYLSAGLGHHMAAPAALADVILEDDPRGKPAAAAWALDHTMSTGEFAIIADDNVGGFVLKDGDWTVSEDWMWREIEAMVLEMDRTGANYAGFAHRNSRADDHWTLNTAFQGKVTIIRKTDYIPKLAIDDDRLTILEHVHRDGAVLRNNRLRPVIVDREGGIGPRATRTAWYKDEVQRMQDGYGPIIDVIPEGYYPGLPNIELATPEDIASGRMDMPAWTNQHAVDLGYRLGNAPPAAEMEQCSGEDPAMEPGMAWGD